MTPVVKHVDGGCPFCGAGPFRVKYRPVARLAWVDGRRVRQRAGFIVCDDCQARGPYVLDPVGVEGEPDPDALEMATWKAWETRKGKKPCG